MIRLDAKVYGMEAVQRDFDLADASVRDRLRAAVQESAGRALHIARKNLAGGVLRQKTGRLADSVAMVYRESPTGAYAKIGSDYYIGRFWELGFDGKMKVRAHFRSVKGRQRFTVSKMTRRGKVRPVRVFETGAVPVKAYERAQDGRPRKWLAPSLEAVRADFRAKAAEIARRPTNGNS